MMRLDVSKSEKTAHARPDDDEVIKGVAGTTGDWLLGVDPERLIGIGRLATAIFAILAIVLDPTLPAALSYESRVVLSLYVVLSVLLVAFPLRWPLDSPVHLIVHLVDAIVLGWLTLLTNELTSPFFSALPFVLLAMTMRWGFRGAVLGALILLLVQLIVGLPDLLDGDSELNFFIIRSTYFVFAAVILGYFGAYRERSRQRLARLAEWPFDAISGGRVSPLELLFKHAARVLGSARLVVAWRDQEDEAGYVADWANGNLRLFDIRSADFWHRHDPQPSHGQREHSFSSKSREQLAALMADLPEVVARVEERSHHIFSAAFSSVRYRGRVFVTNSSLRPDEGYALTEIIATRLGSELERLALIQQTTDAVRSEERIRLARDLHDSVLQNLTAARLKLKLVGETVKTDAKLQLNEVASIVFEQQQRIRQFVEDNRAPDEGGNVRLEQSLPDFLNLLAEQWSCQIETSFNAPALIIPKWLAHEITQLTSEAVANAVRHGRATRLCVSVVVTDGALVLEFIDNGTGILDQAKLQRPSSLSARVARLGGDLTICRTSPGLGVHIELPLALEAH